jgi:hypothetical protein
MTFRRLAALALLIVVATACDGPVATTLTTEGSSSPSSSIGFTTSSTVVTGLRSEFVAWVVPIDGDEMRLAWETIGLPAMRRNLSEVADCWESNGFATFADQVRSYDPGMLTWSGRLLPDMDTYRRIGFARINTSRIDDVLASGSDEPEHVVQYVELDPEFGFRLEDVPAIQAVAKKCNEDNQPPLFVIDSGFGREWTSILDEIDQQPEITRITDETVMPCLRQVDPQFTDAADIDGWFALEAGAMINLDQESGDADELNSALARWGMGFAECMEPLVQARRQPRLEARDALVDDHFTELLQLQSDIDDFLAGNSQ